jgi:creatinine amidohydrolase/Fe(II)-dependent formamide hydrolase-like protein
VLVAPLAVLAHLEPIRIVFLVLHGGVVAALADATREADDVFHRVLFGLGAEKKKA